MGDTTGMTLSWICYELAKNPDLQRRLQEEVDAAYEAAGGKTPDYNDIQGFTFLDQLIQESLGLHTAVAIQRVVTSPEYTLPGTSTKMKKYIMVFFSESFQVLRRKAIANIDSTRSAAVDIK